MCGICGFTGPPRPDDLAAMLAVLEHRGPDDQGTLVTPQASLGVRRLAIIDVANGAQPAFDEERRIAVILNGEIYNHADLRASLQARGHRFRSRSDTEVLPHLYEEYGADMTALLDGMFAFALWDADAERLLIARDRAGEKPLLYTTTTSGLVFASELKSLLANPAVGRDLDPDALRMYLTFQYVPGPRTMLAGVRKLAAGHLLISEKGAVRTERYWDVAGSTAAHHRSFPGAASELRRLLRSSVAAQMGADVPVGALLSGGIDSAGIVALMAEVAEDEPPRTFTVGFEHAGVDERPAARRVAQALGTRHTELVVQPPSTEDLQRFVWYLDEPVADQAALPTFLIAKVASEHVTVVLSGEGSDELFGGYPRYRWFAAAEALQRLPRRAGAALEGSAAGVLRVPSRRRQVELLLGASTAVERHVAWTAVFGSSELDDLLAPEYRAASDCEPVTELEELAQTLPARSAVEQAMLLDFKTWLVDDILTKSDRMSMAASIEARAPYLDRRIIEFATSLPVGVRLRGWQTKTLLREALRDIPLTALRRRKQAFRVPVDSWLASAFADSMKDLLLASDSATGTVLRQDSVRRLFASASPVAARQLWTLGILEIWMRQVLRSPRPARSL